MSLPTIGFPAAFRFLDPGPLIDGELELVAPDVRWIDDVLQAHHHPLTAAVEPHLATTTRRHLERFLADAPGGHAPPDLDIGRFPAYHFWMRVSPAAGLPVRIAGNIALRIGHGRDIECYAGHIGYGVYPPARGQHFAERACRLLFPLARAHGLNPLWITTDPENTASRRTCIRLGAVLVETVDVPGDHPMFAAGARRKCRYRIDL